MELLGYESSNRFMKAILEMLIFEGKSRLEDNIDQLETKSNTYVIEHDDITRAIEEKSTSPAELMDRHMEGILEAVEYQVNLMEKVE